MSPRLGRIALPSLLLAVSAFVWHTSAALPPAVTTRFASGAAADGFMPRGVYLAVLLALVVVVPLFVAFLFSTVADLGGRALGMRDRGRRVAPGRRASIVGFVRAHGRRLAAAVALLLGYVHWLVVRAHELRPPELSAWGAAAGLGAFLLFLAVWLVVLLARFRRLA